ncbi:sugar metabolism transcriptional regulator [Achromatium sp. WMS3]|nr:sugar metabolism transcriptional regulator [Achromatium sp. WMS3]
MILSELKKYLQEHKQAALFDLVNHFDSDAEALRGMLNVLEHKGQVRKLPMGTSCGSGCNKCDTATIEIYAWIGTV